MIYESGHKLGSLRWEIGALLIRYRINKSSKPLWKIDKLTFTKICWLVLEVTLKSKQPFTLSYILSLHCSHVTYLTHQDTAYQSRELLRCHLSLSCLLRFPPYISCQLSSQEATLSWPQDLMSCTPPETNHSVDW